MFTGIIEATATIKHLARGRYGSAATNEKQERSVGSISDAEVWTMTLDRPTMFDDIKIGSSIAISGVCLSVTSFDGSSMSFDVIPTTLKKSMLGSLKPGDIVNLERAMPASGRFEGHIVLGHCEGVGTVESVTTTGDDCIVSISYPSSLEKFIVEHGSIAIDGVSLTIAAVDKKTLTIALIPHTITTTTLGKLRKGSSVNLETDILSKYMR